MHICQFQMDFPPRMAGGTTIHTYEMARAFKDLGHRVSVITASHPEAPAHEVLDGIEVHRVKRPYSFFSGLKSRDVCKDVDAVHGHGICTYGHFKWGPKVPTVVKMHNTWLSEMERYQELKGRAPSSMKLYTSMDRYCTKKADKLICISQYMKRETTRYGIDEEKITVVHNGIRPEPFRNAKDRRGELGLEGTVIGYIGRMERHKGVHLLLDAAKDLDASLLLVGGGGELENLKKQAERLGVLKKCIFTGYLPHEQIPDHYASSDIIVYPTNYEPLGNVVLESMAAGKPLVASNVGGIPEIFQEGMGFLMKPDGSDLKEKLEILVNDPGLRDRMGKVGAKAVEQYSWKAVAIATGEVLKKLISE